MDHEAHGDEDRPRNPDARAWPFGRPDLCRGAVLSAHADEVRIRSIASAINHTDLEIRAGNWPVRKPQPFPYVPDVEVVGEIEEVGHAVQEFRRGDRVITGPWRGSRRAAWGICGVCHRVGQRGRAHPLRVRLA